MKRAILTLIILLTFISAANAQLIGDYCSVSSVDVENTIEEIIVHTEMTYHFSCSGASGLQGQVTKMMITVPYVGIANAEASDNFGSMVMLEGPQYISVAEDDGETVIGVIFRKGLLVTTEQQAYDLKIEFDSVMAELTEDGGEISPAGLAVSPKVTIVTTGLTETTIPAMLYDYSLTLPEGASIQEIAQTACQFQGNVVSCPNLGVSEMQQLEIKWTKAETLQDSVKGYANKLKGLFSGLFGKLKGSLEE